MLYASIRNTHADGDRHFGRAFARSTLPSLLVTLRTLLRATQMQTVMHDGLTHPLKVRQAFFNGFCQGRPR